MVVMKSITQLASFLLVGALWGCTNPLLRKGSQEAAAVRKRNESTTSQQQQKQHSSLVETILAGLSQFQYLFVWLPYLLNQAGSVVYYYTLANSDLSLAVPLCNALALVFSIATCYLLGEEDALSTRTMVGAALVMGGVALCVQANDGAGR